MNVPYAAKRELGGCDQGLCGLTVRVIAVEAIRYYSFCRKNSRYTYYKTESQYELRTVWLKIVSAVSNLSLHVAMLEIAQAS